MRSLRLLFPGTGLLLLTSCADILGFPAVPILPDASEDAPVSADASKDAMTGDGSVGRSDAAADATFADGSVPDAAHDATFSDAPTADAPTPDATPDAMGDATADANPAHDATLWDGATLPDGSTLPDGATIDAGFDSGGASLDGAVHFPDTGPVDAAVCTNRCGAGDRACGDGSVLECVVPDGSCPVWIEGTGCSAHQTCGINADSGVPACSCNASACSQPGSMCLSGALTTCAVDDASCNYVADAAVCPSGQLCGGAAPGASCSAQCRDLCDGGSICSSGGIASCVRVDSGCMGYGGPFFCPDSNEQCVSGAGEVSCECIPSAICSVPGTTCNADHSAYYSCSKDGNGCFLPSPSLTPCDGGACFGSAGSAACCVDECTQGDQSCVDGGGGYVTCLGGGACTAWGTAVTTCGAGSACIGNGVVAICSCDNGYTPCDGGCVDYQDDPANCGGCGVTCKGTCYEGTCAVTLANGPPNPSAMVIDTTHVYWGADSTGPDSGVLLKVQLDGGSLTTLASGFGQAQAIVVDGTNVYWTSGSGVLLSTPLDGGIVSTVAQAGTWPLGLAASGGLLYYTGAGSFSGQVVDSLTDGGSQTRWPGLQSQTGCVQVGIYDSSLYWSAAYNSTVAVYESPLAGGTTTTLASLTTSEAVPWSVAVTPNSVYIVLPPAASSAGLDVVRMDRDGGGPYTVVDAAAGTLVVADSRNVYWVNPSRPGLAVLPEDGGAPQPFGPPVTVGVMALDPNNIYWGSSSGTIQMLPKL